MSPRAFSLSYRTLSVVRGLYGAVCELGARWAMGAGGRRSMGVEESPTRSSASKAPSSRYGTPYLINWDIY